MLAKVPNNIQVRILRPAPEESVPQVYVIEEENKKNPLHVMLRKLSYGVSVGLFIGLGIYTSMKMVGIDLGGYETSLMVLFPSALGLLSSLVIF